MLLADRVHEEARQAVSSKLRGDAQMREPYVLTGQVVQRVPGQPPIDERCKQCALPSRLLEHCWWQEAEGTASPVPERDDLP